MSVFCVNLWGVFLPAGFFFPYVVIDGCREGCRCRFGSLSIFSLGYCYSSEANHNSIDALLICMIRSLGDDFDVDRICP